MAVLIEGVSAPRPPDGVDVDSDRAAGGIVPIVRPPSPEDDHGR